MSAYEIRTERTAPARALTAEEAATEAWRADLTARTINEIRDRRETATAREIATYEIDLN